MRLVLLLVLALLTVSSVSAQIDTPTDLTRWTLVASGGGRVTYVDRESAQWEGPDVALVWEWLGLDAVRRPGNSVPDHDRTLIRRRYYCADRTSELAYVMYYRQGEMLGSFDVEGMAPRTPDAPGTSGEILMDFVCGPRR